MIENEHVMSITFDLANQGSNLANEGNKTQYDNHALMNYKPIYLGLLVICSTLFLLIASMSTCSAQGKTGQTVTISKKNSQEYFVGTIEKISKDSIVIKSTDFDQFLTFSLKEIQPIYYGNYTLSKKNLPIGFADPYLLPTAFTNGQGNSYYRNYFLFASNFSFGVSDNTDVSVGFETFSLLFESNDFPVTILGLKQAVRKSEYVSVAVASKLAFNDQGGAMLFLLPITFGNEKNSFSVIPTLGSDIGDFSDLYPFLSVNTNITFKKGTGLVTDLVYTDGEILITSLLQFTTRNRVSYKIGFAAVVDEGIVPNFGFTIPMSKSRGR